MSAAALLPVTTIADPVEVRNITRQIVLADQAVIARSLWRLLVGLIPYRTLEHGSGMVLPRTGSVHTTGLRFSIDVLFLNTEGTVIGIRKDVRPFRIAWAPRGAHTAIELPAGVITLDSCGLRDVIVISPAKDVVAT